jgi:hypothetical protein
MIKSRMLRWTGHVERMGEVRNSYILVGKPEGKILLGGRKRGWEDDIKLTKLTNSME